LLGYDSNSHAYRVFNKDSGCVETTCDVVFDEINDSQVEQYDLDVIDDEESPCEALQKMTIKDVRLQNASEPNTMSKIKRMNRMKIKLMVKRKALIKGEMRMMEIIKDQE
jgi:hypothetical protein